MEKITYRNLNDSIRGIHDEFSEQELIANDLCRQIFEIYNYNPVTPRNFDNGLSEGTDYGIDDIIYVNKIPKDDCLNLKQFKAGKWDDTVYTIDYKSNNNRHVNSVYIKLMPYRNPKQYLPIYKSKGKLIDPISRNNEIDRRRWKRALRKGKDDIVSLMERYYENKWLLGDNNKTEYYFFVKYTKPVDVNESELKVAHLVPADDLRIQVRNILNEILRNNDDKWLIGANPDFYLNHKIMKAFEICNEDPDLINEEMELFKMPRGDITLRIPDHLLTKHIKFNKYGCIVTSS